MTLQVPDAIVQLVALNVPVLLVVKVTVAVHVDATLSRTLAGEQETAVLVAPALTATVKVPLLPV